MSQRKPDGTDRAKSICAFLIPTKKTAASANGHAALVVERARRRKGAGGKGTEGGRQKIPRAGRGATRIGAAPRVRGEARSLRTAVWHQPGVSNCGAQRGSSRI